MARPLDMPVAVYGYNHATTLLWETKKSRYVLYNLMRKILDQDFYSCNVTFLESLGVDKIPH